MKDFLRKAFSEHLTLKAVALTLAVTMFILVHGDKDAVVGINVKVVYNMPEDRVLVSDPVDSVRVMVRGPWTRIKRFDEREVEPVYVDLTRLGDGEFSFQEDMIDLPLGLEVQSINPPTIRLAFESTETKIVPVKPSLVGQPARGFKIESTVVRPSHVSIRGAKTVVDATSMVDTQPIDVAGKRAGFTTRAGLQTAGSRVSLVNAPSEVEVDVNVVEESIKVTLEKVPVTIRIPESLQAVSLDRAGVDPGHVSIILRGGRNAVEQVNKDELAAYVELHSEDLKGRRSRLARVLVAGLPSGVAVEVAPREVRLSFK